MVISRRSVLNGVGQSTAIGAVMAALSPHLRAAQAAAPAGAPAPASPAQTLCLSMLYRQAEGATFNADAFRDKHLPLLRKVYAGSVNRIELRVPTPPKEGSTPPQVIAAVNIWFNNIADFVKNTQAGAKDVSASMAAIASAPVSAQVDQVVTTLGEPMTSVPLDEVCYSSYFQVKDGGTFDTKYFSETFYPRLAELCGAEVIRRIEISAGAAPASGGKLLVQNSVHVYIRSETGYVLALDKVPRELLDEAAQHSNIAPLLSQTRLHAAG
jgi:hypothetical protein